jgi:MFS family permease
VLATEPLHLTRDDVRWLVAGPTFLAVIGGFTASALFDWLSRTLIMRSGVVVSTLFTLLIPRARNAEQLIALRLITGIGLRFAIPAAFPIAAELMPARHRRTYGAIYEVMLASAFTLLPFVAFLSSVLFMASMPGKLFTGYLMEIIGRRWTMTYSLAGALPGIALMAGAHWVDEAASVVFVAGALITGFTVLSAFPCTRVYLSE